MARTPRHKRTLHPRNVMMTPTKTPRRSSNAFSRRSSVFSSSSNSSMRPRSNSTASTVSWASSVNGNGKRPLSNVLARSSGTTPQRPHSRSGKHISKRNRGKKRIKVGRKFRRKVKESLRYLAPSGYYQETFYDIYRPTNKSQAVFDLGTGYQNTIGGIRYGTSVEDSGFSVACFFDAAKIMDAASVLFNNAAVRADKRFSGIANDNYFDSKQVQIDVLKQWVQLEIKNNTGRNLRLKFWVWELKNNTNSQKIDRNFTQEWANRLSFENTAADGAAGNSLNIAGAQITTVGNSPLISPGMQSIYNVEEIIVDLEPGRSYFKNIQGPSQLYDYEKMAQGERGTAQDFSMLCKGVKGMCMAIIPDMVTDTPQSGFGQVGRLTNLPNDSGFGILVATTYNYVVRMPEQTGFTYGPATTAGTQQKLAGRRNHPYVVQQWNSATPNSGTLKDISDMNPVEPVEPTSL